MKYVIMAVRDRAADVFAQPMFFNAVGSAVRSFSDAVNGNDQNSAVCQHPEDFDLYQLGVYNDEDGSFECHVPKQVAIGKDLKVPK